MADSCPPRGLKHNACAMACLMRRALHWVQLLGLCALCMPVAWADALVVRDLAVLEVQASSPEPDIGFVSSAQADALFKPVGPVYVGGYSQQPRWLRIKLQVPEPGTWWLELQPPILDDARLYILGEGGFEERRVGDGLPFSTRTPAYRAFVFPLEFTQAGMVTYYLRLSSSSALMAELHLWRPQAFSQAKFAEYAAASFIFGVLFVLFLLNLLSWAFMKMDVMGWFALHVLANLALVMFSSGFVSQFVLPESPGLANTLSQLTLPFLLGSSAPLLRSLFLPRLDPGWLKLLFAWIGIGPVLFVVLATVVAYPVVMHWMLVSALPIYLLMMALVLYVIWLDRKSEFYLFVGFFLTLVGGFLTTLVMLGWWNPGLLPVGFFRPASFAFILAMQVGILLRVHAINRERHRATERALLAEVNVGHERHKLVEQSRFIGMITHELKTPLAVIDASTQALERLNHPPSPNALGRFDRIRRSVRRIERLVDQFLVADQIDHLQGRLNRSPVDVARLLCEVADWSLCEPERLQLQSPPGLSLQADAALLRLALANLIDNAIKYSEPDAPIVLEALALSGPAGRGGVAFSVTDQGQGVAPELQQKIFDRYVRGSFVGRIAGAGLGLHLVKSIAEMHQGTASVQSGEGGSVFTLWLPIAVAA